MFTEFWIPKTGQFADILTIERETIGLPVRSAVLKLLTG